MSALGSKADKPPQVKIRLVRHRPKADKMLRCIRLLKGETLIAAPVIRRLLPSHGATCDTVRC